MKRLLPILVIALALLLPGVAAAQGGAGALVIAAGQREPGSVATITQDIVVAGVVEGDVTSWAGSITVSGMVGGDVVSYGGVVTIAAGGQVRGHVLASSGALSLAAGAAVGGQRIQSEAGGEALASLLDLFGPSNRAGGGALPRALLGATIGTLLAAFCALLFMFWPRRMRAAAATLAALPGMSLAVGLLTSLVLGLALPALAALLIASVLGLPLLALLALLLTACYVYGLAVLARQLGDRFGPGIAQPALGGPGLAAVAALALLLALVTVLAPLWGLALFCLLASPGLGAAILSRGGLAVPLPMR